MASQIERLITLENNVKQLFTWMQAEMTAKAERAKSEADNRTYYTRLVIGGTIVFFMNSIFSGFIALGGIGLTLVLNLDKATTMFQQLVSLFPK